MRFTVPASVPLVGAGRDERAVAGKPVELDGRVAGARGPVRWKVVDGPRGRLASAAGRTADFTPTEPGTYTLQLEAGDVSDTVEVDAGYGPFVPIDTQATDPTTNKPAIQVGDQYYTPENLGGTQVLVLDRKTLARVEDNGWTTVAQITQDLSEQNNAQARDRRPARRDGPADDRGVHEHRRPGCRVDDRGRPGVLRGRHSRTRRGTGELDERRTARGQRPRGARTDDRLPVVGLLRQLRVHPGARADRLRVRRRLGLAVPAGRPGRHLRQREQRRLPRHRARPLHAGRRHLPRRRGVPVLQHERTKPVRRPADAAGRRHAEHAPGRPGGRRRDGPGHQQHTVRRGGHWTAPWSGPSPQTP